jgi:Undecaprenyl-phosphate glucose phosphotransferase
MLRQHSHLMVTLLAVADACAVGAAWVLSFWVRFELLPVDPAKGVPTFVSYLELLPLVMTVHLVIFSLARLYRPRRDHSVIDEARDVVKAFTMAVMTIILIDYALPQSNKISRAFIATYAVVGTTLFVFFRASVRVLLGTLRRRGWNQRTAVIVGTGRAAQSLLHAIKNNSWMGIRVLYFVGDGEPPRPALGLAGNSRPAQTPLAKGGVLISGGQGYLRGLPVRGPLSDVQQILAEQPADQIFVALSGQEAGRTNEVLWAIEKTMSDVRLVPEINPSYAMRPTISELDGLPILSLRQTPLYGWNAFVKRAFDLAIGSVCLMIAAIPMLAIAVAVKLSSPGPVLFRQKRLGLDGQEFVLLKFRTMRVNAEAATGPVWARSDDPRRTRMGAFLRRTSLDELPNLFNVLAGHMSLVGPRPERPEFISKFRDEIPRYMLRHKMKAGMTGYAQVKGLRGNRGPLKKRIQHDVYYIRNWSLRLDMRILAQTVTTAWFSHHEN